MAKTIVEAYADFRETLKTLIKKHGLGKPDPRWMEDDIIAALSGHLDRTVPSPEDLAEAAYEGYRMHTGGKSLATGTTIPKWNDLRPDIQEAWRASRDSLLKTLHNQRVSP